MSFPAPDPVSGAGQAGRFGPTLAAALRWLFRREDDPLELIDRERTALGERYWPEAEPTLDPGTFLKTTVKMTEKELRWRIRVRRIRDVLGLIALTSITALLVAVAWQAVSPLV